MSLSLDIGHYCALKLATRVRLHVSDLNVIGSRNENMALWNSAFNSSLLTSSLESTRMASPEFLRPNAEQPVPLAEDFYLDLLRLGGSSQCARSSRSPPPDPCRSPLTAQIVHDLLHENKDMIEHELAKTVRASALSGIVVMRLQTRACVNVTENQYENLVPLDFDKDALLRAEDKRRLMQREKIVKTALARRS